LEIHGRSSDTGERRLFPFFLQIRFDFRRREGFAPFDFRFGGADVVE